MNTFYYLIECCTCTIRFLVSCFTWLLSPPPPEAFKSKAKRSLDTWSATVNTRRARKAQRRASRSDYAFAFS